MCIQNEKFRRTPSWIHVSLQKYFPENLKFSETVTSKKSTLGLEKTEKGEKEIFLRDFISSTSCVPELEGFLHLKDGYRKGWKRVYCILRPSGLYYSTKGKQKVRGCNWLIETAIYSMTIMCVNLLEVADTVVTYVEWFHT